LAGTSEEPETRAMVKAGVRYRDLGGANSNGISARVSTG
jgi:hypothetical protein